MNLKKSPPPEDATEEVAGLIETLLETEQRLAELTAGDVHTVTDRNGRPGLLRRAQDPLRHREEAKQDAILNALPASVALLDAQGLIVFVNDAWRKFAGADALQGPGHGIGLNYLEICDRGRGEDASEARRIAGGIRAVLSGAVKNFSLEYSCHSATEERWIQVTVTPLADDPPNGAVVMHLDVTAKRQTAQRLGVSEWRFRQMAENIRDVFYLVDADSNRMLYISPAYEEIWGRSCESLYAKPESWSDAIHPDDRALADEKNKQGMLAAKFEFEYRIVRPDGGIRWIKAKGFPVRDDAGKVVRIAGVAADVTERKQAEDALQRQQTELRVLFDLVPAMIWFRDTENVFLRVNKRVAEATGMLVEEIEGKSALEIYPKQAAGYYADDLEVIRSGMPKMGIVEKLRGPEDQELWVQTDKVPYRDKEGKVIGIVVMAQDVTERKRDEEALRESEERFSGAFEFAPIGMALVSPDGRWLKVNRALCDLVGYSEAELLSRTFHDLTYPEDLEVGRENVRRVIAGEINFFQMEKRYVHARGHLVSVLLNVSLVRDRQGPHYFITQIQDITERKQAEKEIKFKNTVLQTQQEVSPDAILLVDENSQIISYNQQFIDLWRLSPQVVSARVDAPVLQAVVDQVENSEAFVARVQYLYAHRGERSREEVQLKDGRIVDRYSAPITGADGLYYGRVWYFSDITERKHAAQELLESERRFSGMLGNIKLVSMMLDCEAQITYCNDYLLRLTGWQREEVLGREWFDLFIPAGHDDAKDMFSALLAELPSAAHPESEILTRSGERRLIRWNNSVLRSGAGDVIGTASIGEDITERKEAEDRIAFLNRVYAMLSGINTLIVRVRDRDELFSEACRIAVVEGGFRMALIGMVDRSAMTIVPVASAGKDEELMSAIKGLVSSREVSSSTMVARAIREKKTIVSNDSQNDPQVLLGNKYAEADVRSIAILPLIVSDEAIGALALYSGKTEFFHDEEVKLLMELAGDIAFAIDHIDKQDRLDYLAYYDALTGLANRTLFHERLQQSVMNASEPGRKLALVLLDIERFKTINDTLGRPAGDALIKAVAVRMMGYASDGGRLARIDADHFAIMVAEVQTAEELARLVEQCVGEVFGPPFRIGDAELRVSAKFGIAMFPSDGADADALFRNAEAALKKAKAKGERYLFYTQTMNERVAEKLSLENQLRQALDKEEFVLHYQPKVNLASGKLTSAEALIRWNDPRTGLVPPMRFIPILEETGLIHEVGRWALRKAIEDYLRWRAAGLPAVRIAVNVSPLQLRNRGFIGEIEQAIGIDAHAADGLELEITESLIMEDVKHSIASLQAIRAMGVTIAIDDFGTGFSSLSYLAKLPVDTLKIDRSFVINMTIGPEGLALVSTIISLAHALKLKVVAEGVETEEQARLLRLLNCDEMQGYLFSQAVPVEIFETEFLNPTPLG